MCPMKFLNLIFWFIAIAFFMSCGNNLKQNESKISVGKTEEIDLDDI